MMSALASYYLHVNALLHRRVASQIACEWLFETGKDEFLVFQNQVHGPVLRRQCQ
jgi:hypothetical protein